MSTDFFSRDALLNFKTAPKEFEIKGYGKVYVRSISSGERLRLTELYDEGTKETKVPEKTVILGICDANGQPLFSEADIPKIEALPLDFVQGMALAVVQANAITLENVKLAEGN